MSITAIYFVRPVPIPGTSRREESFSEAEGWAIALEGGSVLLHHPATQNVKALQFRVVGVGYCVPDASWSFPSDVAVVAPRAATPPMVKAVKR